MVNKLTAWIENREGNVAVILAIAIIPILVLVGIAIDLQNTNTSRSFIQYTIDNAVIAGSREMQAGKSEEEIRTYINKFIDGVVDAKSYAMSCQPAEVTFSEGSQNIDVSIRCAQETTLTELIGYHNLNFTVTSGSTYGVGSVDVAFVFDVSGSMGWENKMNALKDAAEDAVDILLPEDSGTSGESDVRISMVSYSSMMDAGDYFRDVTNMSATRTYNDTYTTWEYVCTGSGGGRRGRRGGGSSGCSWQEVTHNTTKTVTNSCVKERIGTQAFTDEDPGPNAWFVPASVSYNPGRGRWDEETCNPIPPLPLTNNRSDLHDYIDDLQPNGATAGHIGVAWGWYTIAPKWETVWPTGSDPLSYDEPDSSKAIILMTDGEFNTWYNHGQGDSFDQAQTLCDNIKEKDVRIYTVAFKAPAAGQQILNYCASGEEFAFTATSADELKDAYAKIAQSISDLRIRY